MSRSNK